MRKFIYGFVYAFKGIYRLFRYGRNAHVHAVASIVAITLGFYFHISVIEWIAIVGCIGSVTAAEAINTAIEELADRITLKQDIAIAHAKDLAAGAVLLLAIAAAIIGFIIFLPKIILLVQ